jgi:[acyl-carrier-protein] S-malonyltransferase
MERAFLFPGQGSQYVGMGKDLAEAFPVARYTFEEVDDALSLNLSRIIFEGPEEELNLTENTQPALLAVSAALIRIMTREAGISIEKSASFAAGHSLGEYSALTAVGSLDLADTAKLVQRRGRAMQNAVPVGIGSMAAIIGMEFSDVQEITNGIAENDEKVCQAANDNSVGQVVISGHKGAVEEAVAIASEKGAKKAVTLPVSAPFHCTLMAPAAQVMAQALADTDIRPPSIPVVSNVTGKGEKDPNEIRRLLVDQITSMVRWRESVQWMRQQGVEEMVEIGAGKVLSGLVRRIDKEIKTESVGDARQLEELINRLT